MESLQGKAVASGASAAVIGAHAALLLFLGWCGPFYIDWPEGTYLPMHTTMEAFAVVMAALIFAVGWYGCQGNAPSGNAVLSTAFLAVGLLDLGHLLSFPGMPAFVTPSGVEKGIHFWLAARAVSTLALVAAASLSLRAATGASVRLQVLAVSLGLTLLAYWVALFRPDLVPATYSAAYGLTRWKVGAEYVLIAVQMAALAVLLARMRGAPSRQAGDIVTGGAIMAMSEACFTLYAHATDAFNFIGHVYKVVGYAYLCRAIFVSGVRAPYQRLRRSEQSLAESESKFRALMEFAPDAILLIDEDGRIAMINAKAEDMFGIARAAAAGLPAERLIPCRERASALAETTCLDASGASFPAEISLGSLKLDGGGQTVAIVRDISQRRKVEAERTRLLAVLEVTPDLVSVIDSGQQVLYLNRAGRTLTGLPERSPARWAVDDYLSPWSAQRVRAEGFVAAERDGYWTGEGALLRRGGEEVPVSIALLCHRDALGRPEYWSTICRDISARKHFERMLVDQLTHDALTGLPNRALILEKLAEVIALARQRGAMLGVFFLDLDFFKKVNDTFGHASGDEVLRESVSRLAQVMAKGDMLARQVGDEFILLHRDIAHRHAAVAFADQVLARMREPFYIDGHEVFLTASLGIALYPLDDTAGEQLLHKAHVAAGYAKKEQRNCHRFYSNEMELSIRARLELESFLRGAVERNELLLEYQPKIDLASGRIVGAEALVRWRHPVLGLVPPSRFIPVAEESGLIEQIGAWVLRAACLQARQWLAEGLAPIRVSVNLSARQFERAGLAELLAAILAETGLDPRCLELEITETTVMRNTESAIRTLRSLKQLNLVLSIDDFGTGYSSLSYLKLFPIDVLKVDRSFVKDVIHDPNDAAITRAIIALAHGLDLQVVAEGVETAEQAQLLKGWGCDEIQGYFFSPPLVAAALADLLRDGATLDCRNGSACAAGATAVRG